MRISDWSSDVCSSDLREGRFRSLGVEQPTTGMVTRDPRAWNFELETAKRYGAGDELIGQFQNVEKQLVDAGNKLVRSQGGAKGPEATGLAVQKALDAKRKEMQEATGALYKQVRSEEHTSELQSLMRISYAVFCLKKKKMKNITHTI